MVTFIQIVICCFFAALLAVGQVLFKFAASDIQGKIGQPLWAMALSPWLMAALLLYLLTAGMWIWVLTQIPLSRAYPFSLLGAALVPILAYFVFGEALSPKFGVGIGLVLVGLLLVQTS
ncbi:hypothetical protein WH91_02195 [Devosia psychrophila]|uniref:EamA-like transporter family protein n=2 Tax=Devosia psychrophila TaxID=728005 RepID=A0A0F5Q0X5_9HYPH|nr:hypothetical protein [Devosia psychrophila]KKC34562.1 hypothetical protein WH91_02195 [Devosia psychrophila]SFD35188.1 hypothetical protein SAMN04488059_14411 [Devosia psychrophila]